MYYVLKEKARFSIYDARVTVEEYSGKYLGHWSILRNLPDEAKDPSKAIGGKASAESRKERRHDQESRQVTYPHRIVLAEKDVDQIVLLSRQFRSMEIEEMAPGDVRMRGLETITQARSN